MSTRSHPRHATLLKLLALPLAWLITSANETDAAVSPADQTAARNAILAGVSNIKVVGTPGEIAVFDPPGAAAGQGAFSVTHDGDYDTMIAAAVWGTGRVVAYPHPGYLSFDDHAAADDTAQLYTNSVGWATASASLNIGIVTNNSDAETWLTAQGFTSVTRRNDWENALTGADLLVVELAANISSAKQTALANFVQSGGGLITGGVGWGYQQIGNDLKTIDGNAILRQAGLGWADGYTGGTTVNPSTGQLGNATAALTFAQQTWAGSVTPSQSDKEQAGKALTNILDVLPDDHSLRLSLSSSFSTRAATLSPTPSNPVSDTLDQAVLAWEADKLAATPVADVTAHPTAAAVYGSIPANPDRSLRTVSVNTGHNRWLSTGMYAEPGHLVTMTFPPSLVNRGFSVQISGHVDNIAPRSSWKRVPHGLARRFPIDSTTIQIASAFGGAIYVDVGKTGRPNLGDVEITTSGAIQAPYFVLGRTTNTAWVNTIRNHPAPYAELACDGVIFSVPSSWIRNLDDPHALMTFWDQVVARQDYVAGHGALRTNPERINLDVQISVGLLHAGYPQQGPTDYNTVNVDGNTQGVIVTLDELLSEGDWGWFHELGHEMQGRPDDSGNHYTFSGDGEVTVNIFANAALEYLVPEPPSSGWGWSAYPDQVMARAITTVGDASKSNFDAKDPYPFYFQLADGFGWDTYRAVMNVYNANHAADRSANLTNQQKKDLWLTRWSEVSGSNMVEYMVDHWKLEVSQSAIDAVNAMRTDAARPLPHWMPLASTLPAVNVQSGAAAIVDLGGAGMSLDGTATLVGVVAPAHGTLTPTGGGSYTYRSDAGFTGTDSFSATYRSSADNTQTFTTLVTVNHGLASSWLMDEGSGSTVTDTGLAGATGTLHGSPAWTTGQHGSAVQFDGIDDRITFGTAPALEGTTDFTLSAWVRTTGSGMIIQQRDGIDGQYMFDVSGNGSLHFWVYNAGFQFNFNTAQTVNDGQWHHVIAMRVGEQGRIYIDGQLAGSASGPVRALSGSLPVAIGYDLRDNNNYFNGTIDDVRIYAYAIDVAYHDWARHFYPGVSDPTIAGTGADPNADGVTNLAAFIQATSPLAYFPDMLPKIFADPTYTIVEFARSDRAAHLDPQIHYTTDLSAWTRATNGTGGVIIEVENNGFGTDFGGIGIDRVTVKIPRTGRSRLFTTLSDGTP